MALRTELRKQGDFLFKNRSYLPLIILVAGLSLYIYTEMIIVPKYELPKVLFELGCLGISIFGLVLCFITIEYSAENTSGRKSLVGQVIVWINASGTYSVVWHPLLCTMVFKHKNHTKENKIIDP
jgi:hypothetical protein